MTSPATTIAPMMTAITQIEISVWLVVTSSSMPMLSVTSDAGNRFQGEDSMSATVTAVHCGSEHTFSKLPISEIELIAGLGVDGDAHKGAQVQHRSRVAADPTKPNLRQVHLMHEELFDHVAVRGFQVAPGDLGENITTRGIDLLGLPVGAMVKVGSHALLAVTGLRNPCGQIDDFQDGLLQAVRYRDADGTLVKLAGVMAVVVAGGTVRAGDPIEVSLPPGPLQRLVAV